MKKLLILSSELLSLIVIAFLLGYYLDKKLTLGGWGTVVCLVLAYILWFFSFYKKMFRK